MNDKRVMWVAFVLMLALIATGLLVLFTRQPVTTSGQVLQFNGQTLSLDGASQVKIESTNTVYTYSDVIVTTKIVTVSVWMRDSKP